MSPPPRRARAWLARILPEDAAGRSVLGDLAEEFRARGGGLRASWWYRREAAALGLRYSGRRVLDGARENHMFDVAGDLRTGLRMLRRNPGTSSLIVATLALAIGAATVGFTFADFALFRGLPIKDSARVVSVHLSDTRGENARARVSPADFQDYRARARSFEHMAAFLIGRAALVENGQSRAIDVSWATGHLFTVMGQSAVQGRMLAPGDDAPGAPPVAVLAHRYWIEQWAGRADVIGRTMLMGRQVVTVVGVATPELEFGNLADVDAWLPLVMTPGMPRDIRTMRFLARLRDGVTFDAAASELAAIGDALAAEYPLTNAGWRVRLIRLSELTGGQGFWIVIALFLLSMGLLVAIATANVSNLVLVRALSRERELAVRTALGAKRTRLLRQLFIEGTALSVLAAVLAVPMAWVGLRLITSVSPLPVFQQLRVDLHEFAFIALLALICPVLFSLGAARTLFRFDVRRALSSGGTRGATTSNRGRGWLVVAQVALAVVLLTSSSLALRSIRGLYERPTGVHGAPVLLFSLDLTEELYPSAAAARQAAVATREALKARPEVTNIGAFSAVPLVGAETMLTISADGSTSVAGQALSSALVTGTTADAGATLGLKMMAGAWWTADADEGDPRVAVVSRETAERYLGGVDGALGRSLTLAVSGTPATLRVVGVSSDVLGRDREAGPPARVWMPLDPATRHLTFAVKANGNPLTLASVVRSVVPETARGVPIESLQTFDTARWFAESSDFLVVGVLTGFALLALALAAAGLFGVVSYTSSQRTAEFGTRLALGATALDVARLVASDAARLLVVGLALGLAGGVGVGFAMRSALFDTAPTDPVTLGGVAILLAVVTLAATAWPAIRAARVDPVQALRGE